jgi:hypothetical protein
VLLAPVAEMGQCPARHPEREADVDRALVRPDTDTCVEAAVDVRVIAVEVVRLAPRRVPFDRMGEIMFRAEDWHEVSLLGAGRTGLAADDQALESPIGATCVVDRVALVELADEYVVAGPSLLS